MSRTLILGAGFGGITVATELHRSLGDTHDIVLIDRGETFAMGLRKLWALVGLGTIEEGQRSRRRLDRPGIRFLQQHIQKIEPGSRRAITDGGTFEGDQLIVALGAEPRADLVPGLIEHGHNLYDVDAIPALAQALDRFTGGRIAVIVAGAPYKCPPAPYECTMLLDEHLRQRKLRDRTTIMVATVQPMLMPNAGKAGSDWVGEQLEARDISFRIGQKIQRIESGKVVLADTELEADIIIVVPPHRVPAVVKESGLTGDGEWIPVDPSTLETSHAGVHAIGDNIQIKLANGLPLPKAGLMAELQGQCVAASIAAREKGGDPVGFDGRGFCFVELGKTSAARIDGHFFAEPEPQVSFQEGSPGHAEEKRRFENERLKRWFGE